MEEEKTVEEVLEASEMGEQYLFDDLKVRGHEGAINYLRDTLRADDVSNEEQYWVWDRRRSIEDSIIVPEDDTFEMPEEYSWSVIMPANWERPYSMHEEKSDPFGVVTFPQYFVAKQCSGLSGIQNGDWAALIDRHLKYIAVNEDYQDDTVLTDALDRFGCAWEQNTTYVGELANPRGDNIPLDYVKYLE